MAASITTGRVLEFSLPLVTVLCLCAWVLSCFSHVWLFVTLWSVARQDPLFMGFSRQEYWSRLLWLPPGDLSNPGIKSMTYEAPALQADSLPLSHQGSPTLFICNIKRLFFCKIIFKNHNPLINCLRKLLYNLDWIDAGKYHKDNPTWSRIYSYYTVKVECQSSLDISTLVKSGC